MNYSVLKSLIETIVNSFKCPKCKEGILENNIDIIWAAWKTINMWIECSKCKKNSMIKVEIAPVDLTKLNIKNEKLQLLNSQIDNLNSMQINKANIDNTIKDENIVDLSKSLKIKNLKVNDLFNN